MPTCPSVQGERFILGKLDGGKSPCVEALARIPTHAEFEAPVTIDIRSGIWLKPWGTLGFNPISAPTATVPEGTQGAGDTATGACDEACALST